MWNNMELLNSSRIRTLGFALATEWKYMEPEKKEKTIKTWIVY